MIRTMTAHSLGRCENGLSSYSAPSIARISPPSPTVFSAAAGGLKGLDLEGSNLSLGVPVPGHDTQDVKIAPGIPCICTWL